MEKIIFRVIVLTTACCFSKKHIFVNHEKNWGEARKYCRDQYTDMSPLTNTQEEELFRKAVDDSNEGWIGIYWDKPSQRWKWSGGDNVTYHSNLELPNNTDPNNLHQTADNVYWTNDEWEWKNGGDNQDFFCLSLTVVQEETTWEEALEFCGRSDSNLTSLLSVTENLLATNQIQQTSINDPVWIGLRYLGDDWMWVNGDSLDYNNWSQGGDQDHQCPVKNRCGALTKGGVWENRDCQEELSFICG